MRVLAILLLLLLLTACFDDDDADAASSSSATAPEILLLVDGPYEAGKMGELVLMNSSGQALEYNACLWTLLRRHGSLWVAAPYEEERACTLEVDTLPHGETARPGFAFDERLPWGTYRIRAALRGADDGESVRLVSREFHVVRPTDD